MVSSVAVLDFFSSLVTISLFVLLILFPVCKMVLLLEMIGLFSEVLVRALSLQPSQWDSLMLLFHPEGCALHVGESVFPPQMESYLLFPEVAHSLLGLSRGQLTQPSGV